MAMWNDATGREYFGNINFMQFMRTGERALSSLVFYIAILMLYRKMIKI